MPHSDAIAPIIIQRYRELRIALDDESDEWEETYWLRFAAQALVTMDREPADIAAAIRLAASSLSALADWFRDFASPARFVIAAMLVQYNVPILDLIAWRVRMQELLAEAGIACDPFTLTMTTLIMNLREEPGAAGAPVAVHEIHRLTEIHDRMKRLHRWLIGPGDIPAFAALTHCRLSPEVTVARIEDAYQELLGDGLQTGHELQTAANLLGLTASTSEVSVRRFREIYDVLERFAGPVECADYGSIAVLTLIDAPAGYVADCFLSTCEALGQCDPDLQGTQSLATIAADVTVLALLTGDDALVGGAPTEQARIAAVLHAFRLASAVNISQIDRDLIQVTGDQAGPACPSDA